MKRYLLSSPKFTGSAALVYLEGVLCILDVSNTDMQADHRSWLFSKAPLLEADLQVFVSAMKSATLVQEDYEVTLEDFTREYPYKRNTHLLPDIWKKLDSMERVKCWQAAKEYRRYCERNAHWYKPKIAAAWIKNKEYLNDWRML